MNAWFLHCSLRHSATTTRCRSWVWASLFRAVLQWTLVVWFYAGIRANGITSAGGKALAKAHFMEFRVISCHFVLLSYVCVFCLKCLISLQSQPWDDFCDCDLCLGPRVSTCNAFEHVATVPTVANIGLLSKGGSWGCDSFFECFYNQIHMKLKKIQEFPSSHCTHYKFQCGQALRKDCKLRSLDLRVGCPICMASQKLQSTRSLCD